MNQTDLEQFLAAQATQQESLKRIADQRERELALREQEQLLRQQEMEQQAELTRSNFLRALADEKLATERAESNRLLKEQNSTIQELIDTVRHVVAVVQQWVHFAEEGKESSKAVASAVDGLITFILGRITVDDLMALAKSVRADNSRSSSATYEIQKRHTGPLRVAVDQGKLVDALLECHTIQNDFNAVLGDLPREIANRVTGNGKRAQVAELVRACAEMNYIYKMIEAVRHYENETFAMMKVDEVLRGL